MADKLICECGKIATWYLMSSEKDWFACDNCVPRGCGCNEFDTIIYYGDDDVVECEPEGEEDIDFKWINEERWEELDNGNRIPCCEWLYDEEGWDKE